MVQWSNGPMVQIFISPLSPPLPSHSRTPFTPFRGAAAGEAAGEPDHALAAAGQLGHTPGGAELDGEVEDLLSPPTELPPDFL